MDVDLRSSLPSGTLRLVIVAFPAYIAEEEHWLLSPTETRPLFAIKKKYLSLLILFFWSDLSSSYFYWAEPGAVMEEE